MKHLATKLAMIASTLACGGEDVTTITSWGIVDLGGDQEPGVMPGPGINLDGDILGPGDSPLPDGDPEDAADFAGFESDEEFLEYCETHPEYAPCAGIGSTAQYFTSHQYHGQGDEPRACYSTWASAVNGACYFPRSKQIWLRSGLLEAGPLDDWAEFQFVYLTSWEKYWVEVSLRAAVTDLHGISGITVSDTAGSQTLWYTYADPQRSGFGSGGLIAGYQLRGYGPIAPNGEDEGPLFSAHTSHIEINPRRALEFLAAECPGGRSEFNIRRMIYNLALHEFLHAIGFAHFQTGHMKPYHGCEWATQYFAPSAGFLNALAAYSATSSGVNILTDSGNLAAEGP